MSATNVESVGWQLTDAAGLSSRGFDNAERDGLGNNVGMLSNFNSSRDENAMTAGQSLTFDDMGMGDCQHNGTFMPCSLMQALYGDEGSALGDFSSSGSYFSKASIVPIEANGRSRLRRTSFGFWDDPFVTGGSYIRVDSPEGGTVDLENLIVTVTAPSFYFILQASGTVGGGGGGTAAPRGNSLPECAKKAILEFYAVVGNSSADRFKSILGALDAVRTQVGFPSSIPPAIGEKLTGNAQASAFTYFHNIYFHSASDYNLSTAFGMALLVHEFTHVMQYRETPHYVEKYLAAWAMWGSGRAGKNPFERRAYVNQDNARSLYEKRPDLLCPK